MDENGNIFWGLLYSASNVQAGSLLNTCMHIIHSIPCQYVRIIGVSPYIDVYGSHVCPSVHPTMYVLLFAHARKSRDNHLVLAGCIKKRMRDSKVWTADIYIWVAACFLLSHIVLFVRIFESEQINCKHFSVYRHLVLVVDNGFSVL